MLYISDEFTIKLGLTCTATHVHIQTQPYRLNRGHIVLYTAFGKPLVYREYIITAIPIYNYTMR